MGQFTDTFLYRDLYFMIKQTYILPGTAFTLAAISSLPEYPRPSLEEPSCYLPESEVMCRGDVQRRGRTELEQTGNMPGLQGFTAHPKPPSLGRVST